MGAFCCCFRGNHFEDYQTTSIYSHCICVRFFIYQIFSRGNSLTSLGIGTPLPDSSLNEVHHSVSRPLPCESDHRCSRLQRDGLVSRREKSMVHFQEESLPLRRNTSSSSVELLGFSNKPGTVELTEDSKLGHSESSGKVLAVKVSDGILYIQPSSEEEDVCPTCLEEYSVDDPKITAKCSHHFHLGCIYEWMERSDNCPICGKEMEFCESP